MKPRICHNARIPSRIRLTIPPKWENTLARSHPRKDKRGVVLISDALPFGGRLWYARPNAASNAVDYVKFYSRSHRSVIRVCDATRNVIETRERGRVQRAEALLVTVRHEPERSVVSITRSHLDIVFDTIRRRVAPAIAIAAGRPFTRTLCHLTTWNVLQSRIKWSAFLM